MPSPLSNLTHKKQTSCELNDKGHAEAGINRTTNEIEFAYTWDGVNWSTPVPAAIDIGAKSIALKQQGLSGNDRLVLYVTTDDGTVIKGTDNKDASNWPNYEDL